MIGLHTNTRPVNQPKGTYPFGKNGVLNNLRESVTNEEGFQRMSALLPYVWNGVIETDSKPILFSTDNVNTAIGYFNPETGAYEPIFDDAPLSYKLGHTVDNWITGQAQRNYKGEMICAFTDKYTFPKLFNADKLDVTSLDDWNLFPFYKTPTITTTILLGGGRIPQGTCYVATKYVRNDGTETPFSPVTRGKTVSSEGTDSFTTKALDITITNIDNSYDQLVVAIITKVRGVTTAVELDPVPISAAGSITVVYTGDNVSQDISLEEILTPPAVYNKVGTMGQLNDSLYLAKLESEPDIVDMQPYANMVTLKWKSELMQGVNAPVVHTSGEKKGFMHDEVYAFYIRYKKTRGGGTRSFHIPGITMPSAGYLASTEANTGTITTESFKVDDIITSFNGTTKEGGTGPWENSTEFYPDTVDFDSTALGGRDLRALKVLHHKMPSIKWCKANLYSGDSDYGKTKLDILGVIAENITIPAKYIGVLSGYEILYAKRSVSNMTVYGQGLMLHGCTDIPQQSLSTGVANIYTSGGNWHSELQHKSRGSYNDDNDLRIRNNTLRFHSFDMLFNRPGVSVDYMSNQLRLRRNSMQLGLYGQGADTLPTVSLVDYTEQSMVATPTVPATGSAIRKLATGSYAPNNIDTGKFINVKAETAYVGEIKGPALTLNYGMYTYQLPEYYGYTQTSVTPDFEETYLTNLKALKSNLYDSFMSQSLVLAGEAKDFTDNSANFGGDVFVCDYTFHTYGRHSADDFNQGPIMGKKIMRRFVCESVSNIHLRYETPGNIYSKWFPRTTIAFNSAYVTSYDRNLDPNQFGYSADLNALNDLLSSTIFSPFRELIYQFPYRIHRGGKLSRQTKTRSWRTFLPLDYYEMQKNMGLPIHLEGMDDKLIIHTENALFLTQDKAKLDSGLLGVTLGTGDIFQFEPQEGMSSKLGYAGTQHELACVRTPIGYIFPDAKQGELYLFKGGLQNITEGLSNFLRTYLNVQGNNPFTGNGISVGWDQKYKRILLSVKHQAPLGDFKVFVDTSEFWNNLAPGEIVLWNNRYIKYDP